MSLIRRIRDRLTHSGPPPDMLTGNVDPTAAGGYSEGADSIYATGAPKPPIQLATPPPRIENRVAAGLSPIRGALNGYWYGLEAGAPRSPAYRAQERAHAEAIDAALKRLEERGLIPGTGRALVLAGAYGVDLQPLLRNFEKVHVVDLSDEALARAALDPRSLRYRDRLVLTQADISGIDPAYLAPEIERVAKLPPESSSADQMIPFFEGVADHLSPLPLEGSFDLVVSPLATDVLPYGPATVAAKKSGRPIESFLGDEAPMSPGAIRAFDAQLDHHGEELKRLLAPKGLVVYSASVRPGNRGTPGSEELLRLGFGWIRPDDWTQFLESWGTCETVVDSRALPSSPHQESMSVYLLEP